MLGSVVTGCQSISIRWINGLKDIGQLWLDEVFRRRSQGTAECVFGSAIGYVWGDPDSGRQVSTKEVPRCSPGKQPSGSKRSRSEFSDLGSLCGIACYSVLVVDW